MDNHSVIEKVHSSLADYSRETLNLEHLRPAAVALTLISEPDGIHVLFTKRTEDLEHHKGEISFPGGGREAADKSLVDTALRESWEEVGIKPSDLEVIGLLDDQISISGYLVTPVVAHLPISGYDLSPDPGEVHEILKVPLDFLLNPENHKLDTETYPGHVIHRFYWGDHMIWGLTAAVLNHFLELSFDYVKEL